MGTVNQKVDPFSRCDSTPIRPPCSSTIFLAMAKPRPVPPCVRVVAALDLLDHLRLGFVHQLVGEALQAIR
jgi:hypothetical protein